MTHALVVDDEVAICRCFETLLEQLECTVSIAASAEEALEIVSTRSVDLVVLDIRLPGMDGLAAVPKFQKHTAAPIIVITAHGDLSTAVSAVNQGAFEYIPKPFELDHVTRVIRRALAERPLTASTTAHAKTEADGEIVGNSAPMQQLFRQIALAAQHDAPVLITGESGTGKELVAHAIHQHGARRAKAIVPVHLASVSESLLERELFGHTAGAFTGAETAQDGLLHRANQGSLFLDEIGEASPAVQVKLLRTIETGEFYRVGSSKAERSDFRLLAATNRPVEYLRSSESFRSDFFYRLSTIHIHVPPLHERRDDIPVLANYFLNRVQGNARSFSSDTIAELQQRRYVGNVRELRNIVLSAAAQSPSSTIEVDQLPPVDVGESSAERPSADLKSAARAWAREALTANTPDALATAVTTVESELISEALEQTNHNRTAAAKRLGIHRETLRDKLQRKSQ